MSSTPLVAWSFALPSPGRDATVGDDRALPVGVADRQLADLTARRRRVDADAAAPLDVEQAAGQDRARAAVRVRPGGVQPAAAQDPGGGAVRGRRGRPTSPARSPAPRRDPSAPGTDTVWSSPPVVAFDAGQARQREQAQLAVLAALDEVAAREQRRRGRAEVEVARVQLGLVGRASSASAAACRRARGRARCRPSSSCRRRARSRSRRAGCRSPGRRRAPSGPRSPSRSPGSSTAG